MRKWLYAGLCVVGTVVPYACFFPFVAAHGLDVSLLIGQIFANPVAAFFAADIVIASVALWVYMAHELQSGPVPGWPWSVVANLVVGVSLALPLFLLLRERAREKPAGH